jgi:glutamate-5-semialdehyde dehydrogenase
MLPDAPMSTPESSSLDAAVRELVTRAKLASRKLGIASTATKDAVLTSIARRIRAAAPRLAEANQVDVEGARAKGSDAAFLDRLTLQGARIEALAKSVDDIVALEDPCSRTIEDRARPNGLRVRRVAVPIGLVAMVYEARPNVTVDAAVLCIKSGNGTVLKGGREALETSKVLATLVGDALEEHGLPREAVTLLPFTDRAAVRALVRLDGLVDLAIPRGGEALIRAVVDEARVPVVQHYKGVCHLYLDAGADVETATRLALNGKLQRPGTCNATECLLVDRADAARLVPAVLRALTEAGCTLHADAEARALFPAADAATDDDWGHEFLAPVLAVRVVDGLAGALDHIALYGSGHTEAILTPSTNHADRWRREVDAACVVVNASTRFHDGGELGLGAEMGIATSRLHWRGPMGLEALTTMKWVVDGEGQTRA